jgi:hypothetical protein
MRKEEFRKEFCNIAVKIIDLPNFHFISTDDDFKLINEFYDKFMLPIKSVNINDLIPPAHDDVIKLSRQYAEEKRPIDPIEVGIITGLELQHKERVKFIEVVEWLLTRKE